MNVDILCAQTHAARGMENPAETQLGDSETVPANGNSCRPSWSRRARPRGPGRAARPYTSMWSRVSRGTRRASARQDLVAASRNVLRGMAVGVLRVAASAARPARGRRRQTAARTTPFQAALSSSIDRATDPALRRMVRFTLAFRATRLPGETALPAAEADLSFTARTTMAINAWPLTNSDVRWSRKSRRI